MQIQQVASQLAIQPDTIRRWERVGLIPPVRRDSDGLRIFTNRDVDWLKCVKVLNQLGVSDDFQREYMKLVSLGNQAEPARHSLIKEELAKIQNNHHCLLTAIDQLEKLAEDS